MKLKACFSCGVTLALLVGRYVYGDEPAKADSANPPAAPQGAATVIETDGAHSVLPGQTLANYIASTHSNLLGIEVATVEPPLRAHLDLKEGEGVVVTAVAADSEGAKAGLKQYDIVARIDEQPITSPEQFHEVANGQQGKKVLFHIVRRAKRMEISLTLPNTPMYRFANTLLPFVQFPSSTASEYRIGVTLAAADDVLRSQLRLADGEGLVITDVVADGPAAQAGLRRHDVLVKLDGKRLTTVEACNALTQEIKDRKVSAVLLRGGKELSVDVTPRLSTATDVWALQDGSLRVNINDAQLLNTVNGNIWLDVGRPARTQAVRWLGDINLGVTPNPAPPVWEERGVLAIKPPLTEQIHQLKRQLEEMQKSLGALEASLQTERPQQPAEQKPDAQTDKPRQ